MPIPQNTDSDFQLHYFDAPNPHQAEGTHRIAYYEWGDVLNPPVICVHGLTRNARDFDFLARKLSKNYRVICIDIAGRGKSDPMPQQEWYENAAYMQDILALMKHLKLKAVDWIGTSMGGMIGMMIAAFTPDKIRRMVLNDVGALVPKEGLRRIADYVGRSMDFADMSAAERHVRAIMQPFGITQAAHWEHVMTHTLVTKADGRVGFTYDPRIGDAFRAAIAKMEVVEDISLWKIWECVKCPVLLIRGKESDVLTHEVAQQMVTIHPLCTLVECEGIGHAPALIEEDQLALVAGWLDRTAPLF